MKRLPFLTLLLFALLLGPVARASTSVSQSFTITIYPALVIVFTPAAPSIGCTTPAGTVVSTLSVTGGDGNPVSYSITGGDTTDFVLSGTSIVVASGGITSPDCGKSESVTVTATQN
jgi:hypothetical protein